MITALLLPALGALSLTTQAPGVEADAPGLEWNARNAEHLLNRAGFGARPAELDYAVRIGHAAFVDGLLAGHPAEVEPFFFDPLEAPRRLYTPDMTDAEKQRIKNDFKRDDRSQLNHFSSWWVRQMLEGPHPLQERMTLFWHGYFTSSYREVKIGAVMIRQNELFREHALGSFEELLREIVRDPAMVRYLSNDKNSKDSPNENLARELMELFTLGDGHYTEEDVKEAARSLTGYDVRFGEDVVFRRGRHDRGLKTVLGKSGRHGADDLIDILLAQEQCPRWVVTRLLSYFEGREPSAARVDRYAAILREHDYELEPVLRALFGDPAFYADDVVGNRIAGPIDFLVGAARRLGVEPPPAVIWLAAGQLGQRLFEPPNVQGWPGGEAWITTSTMLQRGNFAGMLLGVVELEDIVRVDSLEADSEDASMSDEMMMDMTSLSDEMEPVSMKKKEIGADLYGMRRMLSDFYWPDINLTARLTRRDVASDAEIVDELCDELLAVEVSAMGREAMLEYVRGEREALGLADGELLGGGPEVEYMLRRLAHLILSLPEAQLV